MTTELQSEKFFKEMRKGFMRIDKKLDRLDDKLSSVVVEVTSHGRKLDQLVTREEFNESKDQTLTHFDGLSKQIEDLQEDRLLLKA